MVLPSHASDAPRFTLRSGHPDFLDLPWSVPLSEWEGRSPRLENVPRGLSRHPVVFVNYGGELYALKELPPGLAEKEYELLRRMKDLGLPVVAAVGHVRTRTSEGDASVLITGYLEHSLPYYSIFMQRNLAAYRNHLLDAMASLLVELHLAGVFWGDCSLSNTLFRRDAGELRAYLVDAETSEIHPSVSAGMKEHDLDIMEENVAGALADLEAMHGLPMGYPLWEVGKYIRSQYRRLWDEITREEIVGPDERYRIKERVRALNQLGFSIDHIELLPGGSGDQLRLRAVVTDRNFHRHMLHSLTGLEVEENQACQMVNEIQEIKAGLVRQRNQSMPMSVASFHWLNELYLPITKQLEKALPENADLAELYCQVLEHKWYLSEKARRDVGHQAAVEDFLRRIVEGTKAARSAG